MEYRKIENLGIETSLLGFGCMRFPITKEGKIDEDKSSIMLKKAFSNGVNYYDTAYPYHNGDSEEFIGHFLDGYNRNEYYLATKLPCWEVQSLENAQIIFEKQLKRLNKSYVDFYLLHSLNKNSWNNMLKLGILEFCEELKRKGKIKYLGFSFHDDYETYKEILMYKKWDFCQIQLNYMDIDEQAGLKGYELAENLGIPVIVMEPIKGGSLANLPESITNEFKKLNSEKSTASWAMRWVGSLPNVKVILSGMSTMEQVDDNLSTFNDFDILNNDEKNAVKTVSDILKSRVNNGCTGCNYCMPCPAGVNIPYNFKIWNTYGIYENASGTNWEWNNSINENEKAKNCIMCGKCEKACPQKIGIRKDLKKLQHELDNI